MGRADRVPAFMDERRIDMKYARSFWRFLPAVGLAACHGCGGPAPEPPPLRAPISVARPTVVKAVEVATAPAGKAATGLPDTDVAAKAPSFDLAGDKTIAGLSAVDLPKAHLSRVRPLPLPETDESHLTAQPTVFAPAQRGAVAGNAALPSSIVFKGDATGETADDSTDSTLTIRRLPYAASVGATARPSVKAPSVATTTKPQPKLAEPTTSVGPKTAQLSAGKAAESAKAAVPGIQSPKSELSFIGTAKPGTKAEVVKSQPTLAEPAKSEASIAPEASLAAASPEPVARITKVVEPAKPGDSNHDATSHEPTLAEPLKTPVSVAVESKAVSTPVESAEAKAPLAEASPPANESAMPLISAVAKHASTTAANDNPGPAIAPEIVETPPNKPEPTKVAMTLEPRHSLAGGVESERIEPTRPERTPQFIAICQRAEGINRRGFDLAQHGALFAARLQYMQSLEMVADALDAQHSTRVHRRMLAAGFKAIEEADDFAASRLPLSSELNVAEIVRNHQTPVLKDDTSDLSGQAAMSRYLTYAQEQMAAALGDVPQGSGALFGMGKLYSVPPEAHGPPDATGGAKAVAFYQASLMVDRRNFMAANELGVMWVNFGRLPEARAAFRHSLSISSQPVVWENLAAVHRSLGEAELSRKAEQASVAAAKRTGTGASLSAYDVQWVDTDTFARAKPIDADPIKPTPAVATENNKSVAGSFGFGASSRK